MTEVWAEHKDALTSMPLKELADADVSTNFHWDGSLDVVVGMVLEPEFSLPPRDLDHFRFMTITRIVPLLRVVMCGMFLLRRYRKLFLNVASIGAVCSQP